jgi:glycosyltransferase involved in cell wall biosynthesis
MGHATLKVSIITAAYNCVSTISATLQSVAQQDYAMIEHIVVDGASSDGTVAAVKSNGTRIARLISEPDAGVYDAFNKGLRCSTGDVIAFLNCGDVYLASDTVSKIVRQFSVDGTDAVFGDVLIVDAHDQTRVVRRFSSRYFSPRSMAYGLMPAHPTLFMRRAVYENGGEYNTQFRIAADFELCLRVFILNKTSYRYIPEALVKMPRGGLSNSGWRSKWAITREMRRACELDGIRTNWVKLNLRLPIKLLEML